MDFSQNLTKLLKKLKAIFTKTLYITVQCSLKLTWTVMQYFEAVHLYLKTVTITISPLKYIGQSWNIIYL